MNINHESVEMDSALASDIGRECVIKEVHQHGLACPDITI
jgi:hypothetical protein